MAQGLIHESFTGFVEPKRASARSVGLVFATVFLVVGLWPLPGGGPARLWALGLAGLLLLAAVLWPRALAPLARIWAGVGRALHRVTNPLVMGLVFYLVVTPTALVMRALGKDPLRLRREGGSYWIARRPPGPTPDGMKNQF